MGNTDWSKKSLAVFASHPMPHFTYEETEAHRAKGRAGSELPCLPLAPQIRPHIPQPPQSSSPRGLGRLHGDIEEALRTQLCHPRRAPPWGEASSAHGPGRSRDPGQLPQWQPRPGPLGYGPSSPKRLMALPSHLSDWLLTLSKWKKTRNTVIKFCAFKGPLFQTCS